MIRRLGALAAALMLTAGLTGAARAEDAPTPPAQAAAESTGQVLVLLRMPPGHARTGVSAGGGYGDEAGRAARRRTAERLARTYGLQLVDGWPMPLLGVDCYIMAARDGRTAVEVAQRLSHERAVQDAQPSQLFHAQGSAPRPRDPLYATQPAAQAWRLDALHQLSVGRGVRIAVVDSMIDPDHPDLAGQVELTRNFVAGRSAPPESHGTGVAGVIAARDHNGVGIVGVAPGARILGLRACWQVTGRAGSDDTVCDSLSLAQALHFAIDARAQVINLSLSGPPDPLLARLIDVALSRGIEVVAAYDRKAAGGGFPADHQGVVAVADEALARPPAGVYSAPGRDVPTTQPGGRWYLVDGSSYAAAHVSGLLALVDERRPGARARLTSRPDGEIDACATLLRVAGRGDCACARLAGRP